MLVWFFECVDCFDLWRRGEFGGCILLFRCFGGMNMLNYFGMMNLLRKRMIVIWVIMKMKICIDIRVDEVSDYDVEELGRDVCGIVYIESWFVYLGEDIFVVGDGCWEDVFCLDNKNEGYIVDLVINVM